MTCEDLVKGEELERYVGGQLEEAAQAEVERHVFECDACAARLDDLLTLRTALQEPTATDDIVLPPRRVPLAWYRQPMVLAAGVATLMFAAAGAVWWTRDEPARQSAASAIAQPEAAPQPLPEIAAEPVVEPEPPPRPADSPPSAAETGTDWASFSAFDPPAFVALTLRAPSASAVEERDLDAARQAYAEARYDEAERLLEAAIASRGLSPGLAFYRGISRLKQGNQQGGLDDLASVAASSQMPYAVEAHLYGAYGHLARRDVAAARASLERYVALDGDFTDEARRLLERLPRSSPPPR